MENDVYTIGILYNCIICLVCIRVLLECLILLYFVTIYFCFAVSTTICFVNCNSDNNEWQRYYCWKLYFITNIVASVESELVLLYFITHLHKMACTYIMYAIMRVLFTLYPPYIILQLTLITRRINENLLRNSQNTHRQCQIAAGMLARWKKDLFRRIGIEFFPCTYFSRRARRIFVIVSIWFHTIIQICKTISPPDICTNYIL